MATVAQERTLLGQGLAVGALAAGVTSLPNDGMLDLDFRRAWHSWTWRSHFPSVRAELGRPEIRSVLSDSARRRGPIMAAWKVEQAFLPYKIAFWPVEECLEALEEETDGAVPGRAWPRLVELIRDARTPRAV